MGKFKPGDTVLDLLTNTEGTIIELGPSGRGKILYKVRFAENDIKLCLEQNLDAVFDIKDPFELCKKGIFGNRDQFTLVNTTYKINNSSNNTISSLKASKTIFKAYQFKPLLKFLNSQTRRILIADEVGLGKTIEAGHILLELKARAEFKSALIICPNSLKIKWQTELKEKFGLNFKIYESLGDAVEDLKAHPQSARGILNYEKIRARELEGKTKDLTNGLIEFLQNNQRSYSIILCDEAHKMRNPETQTHKGMSKILDHSDSVVFLTATPIMLGEDDLYNLLHLLEPLYYDNKEVFRNLINANRPFIEAIRLLNRNIPLIEIKNVLTQSEIIQMHKIGEAFYETKSTISEVYKGIQLYENVIELLDKPDSPQLRATLQDHIASLSNINSIFSRTRKREISTEESQQTERNAHKVIVNLNQEERLFFDEVIDNYIDQYGGIDYDYYGEEVLPQGAILGLIQRKRMVASCVNGYKFLSESNYDNEKFIELIKKSDYDEDSKINAIIRIFNGIKKAGGKKVVIFSIFKFTIKYLEVILKKLHYKIFAIHGDIKEREHIIEKFKSEGDFSILLSTEVGSEGLDMQFCSHLINYDLPWNPMVVEQRIGRIDRFGQLSPVIHIYNLVVANSIQEIIYDRLLSRIGVFQGVIGDLEMILEEMGEDFKKLENDIYGTQLSRQETERKIMDMAKALETEKIHLNQIEEGLTDTLTNDIYFQNEIAKIRDNKLYVSEQELINYIKMLVEKKLTTCRFEKREEKLYSLIVPKSKPKELVSFLTEYRPVGMDFENLFQSYQLQLIEDCVEYGERILTFDQKYAFENKNIDYANIYNPLIIAASRFFEKNISENGVTFQLKCKKTFLPELELGLYYIGIYSVSIKRELNGKENESILLIPVIYDVQNDNTFTDESLNLKLFGKIQESSEFLLIDEAGNPLDDMSSLNMQSDFTEYISNYIVKKKDEISIKENSIKELRIRQIHDYYNARISKENKNIKEIQFFIEYVHDKKEISKLQNNLRLANYRLRKLKDDLANSLEKLNKIGEPVLNYKLISLSKLKVV